MLKKEGKKVVTSKKQKTKKLFFLAGCEMRHESMWGCFEPLYPQSRFFLLPLPTPAESERVIRPERPPCFSPTVISSCLSLSLSGFHRFRDSDDHTSSRTHARIFSIKRALVTNVGRWCRGCNHELIHHTQSYIGRNHTHTHRHTKSTQLL